MKNKNKNKNKNTMGGGVPVIDLDKRDKPKC